MKCVSKLLQKLLVHSLGIICVKHWPGWGGGGICGQAGSNGSNSLVLQTPLKAYNNAIINSVCGVCVHSSPQLVSQIDADLKLKSQTYNNLIQTLQNIDRKAT